MCIGFIWLVLGCSGWYEFKNFAAAEIGRLQWQQSANRQTDRQTEIRTFFLFIAKRASCEKGLCVFGDVCSET